MGSVLLVRAAAAAAIFAGCGAGSSSAPVAGAGGGANAGASGPIGGGGTAGAMSAAGAVGGANVAGASSVGGTTGAGGQAADTFIAFASSFDGFTKWTAFPLGDTPPTTNEMDGPRTVYVNKLPPKGSTQFPVGTIIVKAIEIDGPSTWQTFAMVKRGGDFNALGANGWEWFEISVADDYTTDVLWRGVAPPSDADYGGGTKGGICNGCHMDFPLNDYVQDAFLQLPSL